MGVCSAGYTNEKKEYINAYDMLLGSCYYQIKWGCGSEENLARGCDQ